MFYDYNDQGRKQSQTAGEISDASIWGGIAAPQQSQSHSGRKSAPKVIIYQPRLTMDN